MTIEIEDVFEAAQALQEDGTEASTRNVQAKLGSKAHSYIPAFTGLWNRRNAHLAEASELPDAFLEEAKLLALGLWKTANDRADIREELHLREIERLRSQMAERERMWSKEREEMEKRINEAYADITCLTDEVCELKEQLHAAQEQVVEAEKAKEDAEDRRDKAEARFTTYSGIVQSGNELDKAQLEGALARAAQLEFEIEGMRDRVRDADARRAEDAARFDSLLQEFMGRLGNAPSRKPRATKSPTEET